MIVERLWLPPSHWLRARKRNLAISGWALIASSVANIVAVSTPLRTVSVITVSVIGFLLGVVGLSDAENSAARRRAAHRGTSPISGDRLYLDRVGAEDT